MSVSPSASSAATVPTSVPAGLFSATLNAAGTDSGNDGAALAVDRTTPLKPGISTSAAAGPASPPSSARKRTGQTAARTHAKPK